MQATGSCYNIRTTLRFRNRPSNRSALRNRPAAARPRRHFTGCLSQADPGCLRSSPNLPTLPQGRAGDAPLLRHAKHRFSQPHSPERVQVFPTDSKGVQGTRPETEHRVSEEIGEGLTSPTEPPGASRQRVWCCCVLTGAFPTARATALHSRTQKVLGPVGPSGLWEPLRAQTQQFPAPGCSRVGMSVRTAGSREACRDEGSPAAPTAPGCSCGCWQFPCQGLPEQCQALQHIPGSHTMTVPLPGAWRFWGGEPAASCHNSLPALCANNAVSEPCPAPACLPTGVRGLPKEQLAP